MKEIRLKIENDMSKAQEEAILIKLNAVFIDHPANYLASLFNTDFIKWAAIRISNDFPLDVMEYINSETAELLELKEDIKVLEEAKRQVEEFTERQKATFEENREKTAKAYRLLEKDYKGQLEISANYYKRYQATQETAAEMLEQSKQRTAELERLQAEVNRLKVKLFDLIEREEKTHRAEISVFEGLIDSVRVDPGVELTIENKDCSDDDPDRIYKVTAG